MFQVLRLLFFLGFSALAVVAVGAVGLWHTLWPTLPDVETLRSVELQTPLRIYTRDGKLMREFGEKRRVPLSVDQIPQAMKDAVIATEDRNFLHHRGVDPAGIARAVLYILREGRKGPGGSTITMQVARNFFLDRGKTYTRKLTEIMLALKIEQELGKDEILELYLNKIFLGHRAYGVGAAAQVYYGKRIDELSLAQMAMVAGLPQRPSDFNPVSNPDQALRRRDHVLWRMHKEGMIDVAAYQSARSEPLSAELHDPPVEVEAPYLAEMVRLEIKRRYGEAAFSRGYDVYTTIDSALQVAADAALRKALIDYDRRHGWRGAELQVVVPAPADPFALEALLSDIPTLGGLTPALVLQVAERAATVYVKGRGSIELDWPALQWASPHINENRLGKAPQQGDDVLAVGDVVRVQPIDDASTGPGWRLGQLPDVEGALVALDPQDGSIVALSGGFDFNRSKFNRAVQAKRQPGSSFKPFIYSAALEKGFTAATTVNDSPVVFESNDLASAWRPENYSGKFQGPTRLRSALAHSRNLVSIRLLQSIGLDHAFEHLRHFGLDTDRLPRDLSLALGSGSITPLELTTGYAVLANGGYLVQPHVVARIESRDGEILEKTRPARACRDCETLLGAGGAVPEAVAPRTISAENAWIMTSMMRDVISSGTARKALVLERADLAGKTGTTNDQRDAWFAGFNADVVAAAWVGFDRARPLGSRETGGAAALPMWIDFMAQALAGRPEHVLEEPPGMIRVRIDPDTGLLASAGSPDAIYETFRADQAPGSSNSPPGAAGQREAARVSEQLF